MATQIIIPVTQAECDRFAQCAEECAVSLESWVKYAAENAAAAGDTLREIAAADPTWGSN